MVRHVLPDPRPTRPARARARSASHRPPPGSGISADAIYYWINLGHLPARRGTGNRLAITWTPKPKPAAAQRSPVSTPHPETPIHPCRRRQYETTVPTVADRVVQAALKLVLEPIFETDFLPVSYGFRPKRRAHDAIAEIHHFGTRGYRWVLDADIEACFDSISHTALMDRVRARVKDKRVLALVKAFLKAGVLTELGDRQDTHTGTPQGGILSPLLANIALSALDEHVMAPWQPGGSMSTLGRRSYRRSKGRATWRIVRYADLCRARHKSAYAEARVMPTWSEDCLFSRSPAGSQSA